jgi:hypothetical protein
MKEYIFQNILNSNITIHILANNKFDAIDMLKYTIQYSNDYKLQ